MKVKNISPYFVFLFLGIFSQIHAQNSITFQVDMSYQIEKGVFNKNKEYRNELETQTLAIVEATEGFENYGIEVQNLSNNALVDFIAANKDVLDSINKVTQGLDAAVDGRRTLSEIDEDIKAQKELLQQATAEEASAILDLIDVLNKEREAFERKRKSGKKVQENLKGTTGFIEEQISKYEKLIKSTARTSEEYEEFSKKIKALREELFNLNSAFELVDGKNSKVDFKINLQLAGKNARKNFLKNLKEEIKKDEELKKSLQSNIDKALAELDRFNEARLNGEKIYNDYVKEQAQEQRDFRARIAGELFGTFANYYNLDLRAFQDLLEGKTFLETDYAATVNSIVDSVYAGKFQKYEQDLQKNQERLDAVLNDENASDKKKEQARIEFDRKEKELNIKKAKAQRDALLFQIAIDTAQTIAKILLNAAALSSNPITAALAANAYAQAGIAAGFGIAQAAIVSRQALPEFFLGKDRFNNFEGWGTVGEKRKEVIIGGDGSIEVTPNKKTPRFINRDDIIVPSLSQFNRQIQQPNSDLSKTLATRLGKDTKERLSLFQTSPAFDQRSMQNMMEKVMSKYMSKPFNINNNVTIKQKRTKFHV